VEETIVVRGARQLLTLRGPAGPRRGLALREIGIIPDGALLIRGGIILEAGPTRRIEKLAVARHAREINAAGRVVMPGFVDCCSMVAFPHFRGEPDAELEPGLNLMRATSSSRLSHRAAALADGMARHGTTSLEAKSGIALDRTGELKMLRAAASVAGKPLDLVSTYFGARAVAPEFQRDPECYLAWPCSDVLPLIRRRKLAAFVEVSCEKGAFNIDQARRYLLHARRFNFGLKVHADQASPTGGARLAAELEARTAEHVNWITQSDVRHLSASATIAVVTAGGSLGTGVDRCAPARALVDAGAAVALASGFSPGLCATYNMQVAVALACLQMKLTPAEAICAATVNAAHAIGRADRVGSLVEGRQADLLLLNVADYREIPYYFGVNHVHKTLKRGVTIFDEDGTRR
jgi:imidazolonepropionase